MNAEIVYLGHDNTIDLILKADGSAVDLSGVTKITATFGDVLVESTDNEAGAITWAVAGYDTGEIRLDLGGESIAAGRYKVPIVVFDASNPNGVVWGSIRVGVEAEVEAES